MAQLPMPLMAPERPDTGAGPGSGAGTPSDPSGLARRLNDYELSLRDLSAAVLVVDPNSLQLLAATREGLRLLCGGTPRDPAPLFIPISLRALVERTPLGAATEWRPPERADVSIICTRYAYGPDAFVLWLRENAGRTDVLSQRLHRQRLEITGRLVAMIAHDLRVPLTSIVFNADVAHERQLSAEELSLTLADIRSAAARMRHSIDSLLDFARLGGRTSVIELSDIISRVESLLRPQMRDGSHQLQIQLDPQANWVRGNPLVVEQVLVNLLMNAMEASPNPVKARVTTLRIRAADATASQRTAHPGEDFLCLVVEDDGPGILPELREQIFEPFFTTKPEGTGLGLPMAREALASIDAALTLEPSPRGARFVLWFPWQPPPREGTP
ncbi:MAG: HAMP domain-containing sensor histidine kinase [Polyangiales bacterium]